MCWPENWSTLLFFWYLEYSDPTIVWTFNTCASTFSLEQQQNDFVERHLTETAIIYRTAAPKQDYFHSTHKWLTWLVCIDRYWLVPVSCFCISAESVFLRRATASVIPPQRWISSLFLLFLKDRLRRAAEAVWWTRKLGLRSRPTNGGIPSSFNTCGTRGLQELAQLRNTIIYQFCRLHDGLQWL